MNKKGNFFFMILFFVILLVILFLGFVMVVGSSVINLVFDEVVPELTGLGQIGDANMTEAAAYTIIPLNNIIQNFTWLTGVLYVMMLVGSIIFIVVSRTSSSKWAIGFYFMLVIVVVIASIFISNMYEDFYDGNDDLATRLKEHVLLSYMILYSPMIFTIIGFIAGVIIFSGIQEEDIGV
jgi:hypothetical protein